ncbi:patatin-like phospholipase family protein [Erythrobacter sp. HA6-11]
MNEEFDQLAFSGGGIRCFWHGGFMSRVGDVHAFGPERVTGVSGGVLSAAAWIGEREDDLRDLMSEAFRINDANVAAGRSRFTPHQEMYRAVVATTLDDRAVEAIADGPEFFALLTVPPRAMPGFLATALYGPLYKLEQAVRGTPHLGWSRKLGLECLTVDARQAARDGSLIDLICIAATIPPVFPVRKWGDKDVMDGGFAEKVHVPSDDRLRTLALLSSQYPNLPQSGLITYAQPSAAVAADKIDFTDPEKIERTWQQGEKDAKDWLSRAD